VQESKPISQEMFIIERMQKKKKKKKIKRAHYTSTYRLSANKERGIDLLLWSREPFDQQVLTGGHWGENRKKKTKKKY